ncbi:MAG TPA: hypothetical protein PKC38_12080 [Chitinophagales bacterium]|nr:hypothetical protein [Chitinophagales bacterium]
MKYLVSITIGFTLCMAGQFFLPWWWIFAPLTFLISFIVNYHSAWRAFFAGLLIVFISWMAAYIYKDLANDSIMSGKMANLFNFKNNYALFFIVAIAMGIIGGLTSTAAYFTRNS